VFANTGNFSNNIIIGTRLQANSSNGSAGQVLTSGGASGNVYWAPAGIGSISDDTTTNADRYILFKETTTGSAANVGVSSTKLKFNPSTGDLSAREFSATSDERLKSDITILNNALDRVIMLRGVSYKFTDTGKASIGLIAQEVESVVPEVVTTKEDGYKTINYGTMVGLLVEAIKELKQEIQELKNGNQS